DGEQAQPREYLGCWRANCEDYVVVGPIVAVVGQYHIHAAGGPQKEPVGPAIKLHHKKKRCVGCWAVRVGLADCIGPDKWSGSQKGVEKSNAYFFLTGKSRQWLDHQNSY
ncbi:hypothetical protein Tco_0305693, partial [Tanacetum coccineum]